MAASTAAQSNHPLACTAPACYRVRDDSRNDMRQAENRIFMIWLMKNSPSAATGPHSGVAQPLIADSPLPASSGGKPACEPSNSSRCSAIFQRYSQIFAISSLWSNGEGYINLRIGLQGDWVLDILLHPKCRFRKDFKFVCVKPLFQCDLLWTKVNG